jgi:paraquat-inducible protein B
MDFFPDSSPKLFGVEKAGLSERVKPWWEIPTISNTLQDLEQALGDIDFKDMANDFKRAMDGIAKLASSPELHASIGELQETLMAVKTLARDLDGKVEPLATSLDQTLADVRAGIGDARKMMATDVKDVARSAKIALNKANETLESVESLAEEGTQLRHEISEALKEVAAASRSVRVLADFIEQHPDAVLRGRITGTGGN